MTTHSYTGLFVAEGSSDLPLANIVESLFLDRGVSVRLSTPDFALLPKVAKDVKSRIVSGLELVRGSVDVVVVHRDSDNVDPNLRREEIERAVADAGARSMTVPVIPVRMTEAWLLLDEIAIRQVAGNPRGKVDLCLPKAAEVERKSDPKKLLQECLLAAAEVTGRRRDKVATRFGHHRRQLLERLDISGPVATLESWRTLVADVEAVVSRLAA